MTEEKRTMTIDDVYNIVSVEDPQISPDGRWIAYVQRTVDKMGNTYKTTIWAAPTDGGDPIQLTRSGKDSSPRWSPDGERLAFVSARADKPQIYLLPVGGLGGEPEGLTSLENGATSPEWSPDGTHIAFVSRLNAEERAKEDSDDEEDEAPPADEFEAKQRKERKQHEEKMRFDPRVMRRIPYRQGTSYVDDRFSQVYVIAVDGDEKKPRRLTDIDCNYQMPQWTADSQYLVASREAEPGLDEPWRNQAIYRISVEDGTHETLVEAGEWTNFSPLPSPDGQWIAYARLDASRTDGLLSLLVMPTKGGDPVSLTAGYDRSIGGYEWDGARLLFTSGDWGNTEIYAVTPHDGTIDKVIPGRMEAGAMDAGPEGGIAFTASTPYNLSELYWQPAGADEPLQLTDANQWLEDVIVQETHELIFTHEDGTELQGWYILPPDYEEGKQYPLAFNIHGGPHVMWGPSAKTMFHEWQTHAARGYVVFYCNPRGSQGYGEAFNSAIRGTWGGVAHGDLMAGIDALLEMGFVDEGRMAITGGSYGGYMTAWSISQTDRFAAAVPQRGVYNIVSFYGTSDVPILMSAEFGGEPWEPEAYERMWAYSPVSHAHKITTPLLIIHSENDFRVPIEQAEQLFAIVRRSGDTPVEMWRYPREGHELSRSGEPKHRISRLEKMIDWFDTYCMPSDV